MRTRTCSGKTVSAATLNRQSRASVVRTTRWSLLIGCHAICTRQCPHATDVCQLLASPNVLVNEWQPHRQPLPRRRNRVGDQLERQLWTCWHGMREVELTCERKRHGGCGQALLLRRWSSVRVREAAGSGGRARIRASCLHDGGGGGELGCEWHVRARGGAVGGRARGLRQLQQRESAVVAEQRGEQPVAIHHQLRRFE